MQALVFTSQSDAITFSATVNTRLSYPKNGVDVGGGIHASKVESATTQHGDVVKHPTLTLWRYPNDVAVQIEIGKGLIVPATGSLQTLDSTWFPVAATSIAVGQ